MIIDKAEFCSEIEHRYAATASSKMDHSIIDTVIKVCSERSVELEFIKPLLNRSIIEKIENEAQGLNMLKAKRKTYSLTSLI